MTKEATEFFDNFKNGLLSGIYTLGIGQIESFDASLMQADVVLLPDNDLITNVPVSSIQTDKFVISIPYKKDDYVVVGFAYRDIDSIMHEDGAEPSGRMLSLDDAIVLGGLNLFTKPLPKTVQDTNDNGKTTEINPNDLIIATKDFKNRFVMKESGGLSLYSDVEMEIVSPMGLTLRADNPSGKGLKMIDKD